MNNIIPLPNPANLRAALDVIAHRAAEYGASGAKARATVLHEMQAGHSAACAVAIGCRVLRGLPAVRVPMGGAA